MKTVAICILICCAVTIYSCDTTVVKTKQTIETTYSNDSTPADSAIAKAVHDVYAAISFKGGKPVYANIPVLFLPQAQLISCRADTPKVMQVLQYVDVYKQLMETKKISLFYEEEVFGHTEQFGNIAHRISTYKTYINTMDSVAMRGVNSFQLVKTPAGWKVASVIWDAEKPGQKIPEQYLKP